MKARKVIWFTPFLLAACSAPVDDAASERIAPLPAGEQPAAPLPPGEQPAAGEAAQSTDAPFSGDDRDLIATVKFGEHTVYFFDIPGIGLSVAGHSPLGTEPLDPNLMNLDPVTLYQTLAPDETVPEALLEAQERSEQDAVEDEPTEAELTKEMAQEEADTPMPMNLAQKEPVELEGVSEHDGDYFYRYYCYTGSLAWCETDVSSYHTIWLGSNSHKSAMYIDVIAGSVNFVWWTKNKTDWKGWYGTGHWWWYFHNTNHKYNIAWDKDHGWGVYPAANSVYHWTGWHCGNDCFVADNNGFIP